MRLSSSLSSSLSSFEGALDHIEVVLVLSRNQIKSSQLAAACSQYGTLVVMIDIYHENTKMMMIMIIYYRNDDNHYNHHDHDKNVTIITIMMMTLIIM